VSASLVVARAAVGLAATSREHKGVTIVTEYALMPHEQTLEIHTDDVNGRMVVRLVGLVDVGTAQTLKVTLLKLLSRWNGPMVLDLAGVSFVDFTGLSALLAGHLRAQQVNQDYRLAGLRHQPARLFKLTALDTLIPIHSSIADACAAADGHAKPPSGVLCQRLNRARASNSASN
jgi:anti-anti-sigma factor